MKRTVYRYACALLLLLLAELCQAQVLHEHVVQRGETIKDIANQYQLTEEAIREANPQIGNYFYAGMKLAIPVVTSQETTEMTISDNSNSVTNHVLPLEQTSSSTTDDMDGLGWIQASYIYGFGDGPAKYKSAYGFHFIGQRIVQNKYGVGAAFGVTENVGFVPFDNSTLGFFLGPAFSFFPEDTKCVYLTVPICLSMIAYFETNQEKAERGIDSSDQKIKFGFLTTPQINIRISKVILSAGIDITVRKKTTTALRVGIGLSIY